MKDQIFNASSVGDLAAEFAAAVPGFPATDFKAEVMAGLPSREFMARLEWIADCLEPHLAKNFPQMAAQLEAAMVPELAPDLHDDDFGHFIHAVPGILAVRHGLEAHRERAFDLLYEATKRFSMEFYIRAFLNRWPDETMARLALWAGDENYHVRRLVSEGTRAKLPWARKITIDPLRPLDLLDRLYDDDRRYVTRSVANHLNDLAKIDPNVVVERLKKWRTDGGQLTREMDWITRHALRTLVKQGHSGALKLLGYRNDLEITARLELSQKSVKIGEVLEFTCAITTPKPENVLVDYILHFHRPSGREGRKVFKLKQGKTNAGKPLGMNKKHPLKGNASTFTLHAGTHRVELQVNGRVVAEAAFDLIA